MGFWKFYKTYLKPNDWMEWAILSSMVIVVTGAAVGLTVMYLQAESSAASKKSSKSKSKNTKKSGTSSTSKYK